MNQTLLNMLWTKIIYANISKTLWSGVLKCSAYELTRTHICTPKRKTPSELWHGRNDLSKLRICGCRAWNTFLLRRINNEFLNNAWGPLTEVRQQFCRDISQYSTTDKKLQKSIKACIHKYVFLAVTKN